MHLVCPKCGAKNRVPSARLKEAPMPGCCSRAGLMPAADLVRRVLGAVPAGAV